MEQPQLVKLEQVSDGWIKKYIMTFHLPNGHTQVYESVSRKGIDDYRAELARNAQVSEEVIARGVCASDDAADVAGGEATAKEANAAATGAGAAATDADATAVSATAGAGTTAGADASTEAAVSQPSFGPDGVCIVARTPRDSLVMVREFRYPLNSWCVSFPAGLVERGENFIASVDRELREETGYALLPGSKPRPLPQPAYSSTGMGDETVQIVFVDAERVGDQHLEPAELIEPFELPRADIKDFLRRNRLPIGTRAQLVLCLVAQGF
ncbi:MAG: NUDIX hydrolase [Eggerthellaceae bacterium]|jgi:ADP-ribose pyrophosphatase